MIIENKVETNANQISFIELSNKSFFGFNLPKKIIDNDRDTGAKKLLTMSND